MTLDEETLRLGDERDRLDDRLDELAQRVREADTPSALRQTASETQARYAGVVHLCEEYGEDATVTISPHTAGSFARVEDRAAQMREAADGPIPGASRNVNVAVGLDAAPFIPDDVDSDELDAMLEVVNALPVGVAKYLDKRVNAASEVSGEDFRSFSERLAETTRG